MAKVTVESAEVRLFEGISKKTGNPYSFKIQEVLLWSDGEKYPRHAEVMVPRERDGQPYQPGDYEAKGEFYVDRNGRLSVGFVLSHKGAVAKAVNG